MLEICKYATPECLSKKTGELLFLRSSSALVCSCMLWIYDGPELGLNSGQEVGEDGRRMTVDGGGAAMRRGTQDTDSNDVDTPPHPQPTPFS